MDRNFCRGFADAMGGSSLGHRGAVDPRAADQVGGSGGHIVEHGIEIVAGEGIGIVVMGENGRVVLERHRQADLLATDVIDEFVVRNGMQPGGEGPVAVPGHAAGVDGQQGLLHEILRVRRKGGGEPPDEIWPQMPAEFGQQLAIGCGIAIERSEHQASQSRLDRVSLR